MKLPVKFQRASLPGRLAPNSLVMDDPRPLYPGWGAPLTGEAFTRAASALKLRGAFKTTAGGRHAASNALAADVFAGRSPSILDVGASDGSTSLDLMEALAGGFSRYVVTDLFVEAACARRGRRVFFYDRGRAEVAAGPVFVAYADTAGALPGMGLFARALLAAAPRPLPEALEAPEAVCGLMRPELLAMARRDRRVTVRAYDMFEPFSGSAEAAGGFDLVKAANVLNPVYFGPERLRQALGNLGRAVAEGGRLLVVDNRPGEAEAATLLRREGESLVEERRVGAGAETAALAAELRL